MAIIPTDVRENETTDPISGVKRKPLPTDDPQNGPISPDAYVFPGGAPPPPQTGNSETPRERTPNDGPGTMNAPNVPTAPFNQAGTGPQRAIGTPGMPSAPTPSSMRPFVPMQPPGVTRKIVGGPVQPSGLLGRAGGLLGGGLGVAQGGQPGTPDVSALMQQLLQNRVR